MSAPAMSVKCSVNTCTHHNNNYCTANDLQVNNMPNSRASTSSETQCETFAPKG